MMAKTLVSLLLVAGWNAHAGISRAAITTVQFSIHGLYTTADPTCRTGLVATIPITATPTAQNFVGSPTLGTGSIPTEIKCVVMLVKNQMVTTWAAGTYTTSTLGNPDSVCNAGKTETVPLCNGADSDLMTWPDQISQDLVAKGLTAATTCVSGNANMIVPLYLSTYSVCPPGYIDGATVAGCVVSHSSVTAQSQFPLAEETTSTVARKGIKLTNPGNKGAYTLFADPDGYVGADSANPAACILGGLKFGFR